MFKDLVLKTVAKIPRGRVLTYAQVARLSGQSNAARAVGNILHRNHDPHIPCHRVVRSDGAAGGYNRGRAQKIVRLKSEGVPIVRGRVKKINSR